MDLKPLSGGVRVTGPMKVNGVPQLRRVNAYYVIATSAGVDM
jgi:ribosomal protein L14E/L6E/L27E